MVFSTIPLVHQAALIDNSRDILMVCARDGQVIAANAAFTRILGWDLDTARGRGLSGMVHPDDVEETLAAIADIGTVWERTFTNRQGAAEGDWVWVEWTGQRDGDHLYFVGRDVSDRMGRDQAQELAHEQYVEAQLLGGVGHWRRDLHTGQVIWSEGVFAIFALKPEEFHTEYDSILDHVHPEDRSIIDDALVRIAATGQPEQYEFRIRRHDGERIIWSDGRREDGPDGPKAVFGVIRDVTEERRRLAALDQARQEAVRIMDVARAANAEKSRFLACMSHELRTPLNAIIGFTEMMALGTFGPLPERYGEYAVHVLGSARFLLALINDMLDLSRIEAGARTLDLARLDPAAIVSDCLDHMAVAAKDKRLALTSCVPPDPAPLEADERAVSQILLNLLSNAVKFTPAGGAVTVRLRTHADGGLELSVSDTGIGIAPEDQVGLFRVFTRARQADALAIQGTGLGLALVKALADLHGAAISLDSVPDRGTTVSVLFPRPSRLCPDTVKGPR